MEEILSKIREANATGAPTADLRKQLHSAIAEFRGTPTPQAMVGKRLIKPTPPPKALVITARRAQPEGGERVEVVPQGAPSSPNTPAGTVRVTPVEPAASPSRIADLVRQIRIAEVQGKPTEQLRRQLDDAMNALK
jgi:hypothetical protein